MFDIDRIKRTGPTFRKRAELHYADLPRRTVRVPLCVFILFVFFSRANRLPIRLGIPSCQYQRVKTRIYKAKKFPSFEQKKIFPSLTDIFISSGWFFFCYLRSVSMPTWSAAEAGNIHHPNLLMSIYFYKGDLKRKKKDVSPRCFQTRTKEIDDEKIKTSTSALLDNRRSRIENVGARKNTLEKKDAAVRAHALENVARIAHAPLGITHVDDIESAYWNLVTPSSFEAFSLDSSSLARWPRRYIVSAFSLPIDSQFSPMSFSDDKVADLMRGITSPTIFVGSKSRHIRGFWQKWVAPREKTNNMRCTTKSRVRVERDRRERRHAGRGSRDHRGDRSQPDPRKRLLEGLTSFNKEFPKNPGRTLTNVLGETFIFLFLFFWLNETTNDDISFKKSFSSSLRRITKSRFFIARLLSQRSDQHGPFAIFLFGRHIHHQLTREVSSLSLRA